MPDKRITSLNNKLWLEPVSRRIQIGVNLAESPFGDIKPSEMKGLSVCKISDWDLDLLDPRSVFFLMHVFGPDLIEVKH